MRRLLLGLALSLASFAASAQNSDHLVTLDYDGFSLTFDCENRTAVRFEYLADFDVGYLPRPSKFTLDPQLPAGCQQQWSTASYASVHSGYDRGHLVPANHMDHSNLLGKRANYMTNIVPQVASFNRGIWEKTEEITECYRDLNPVRVYGGLVYGDERNDFFRHSHGVPTPEYFWKVLVTRDDADELQVIGWFIPNKERLNPLDSYIMSVAEIEELIGDQIDIDYRLKHVKPHTSWSVPRGCDRG
ncbi:DNA/RNA non-specific endonuclease [Chitinimonas lacunae]|uniref:DNA/RNA non-specific endonuclease n=1 Tax=Chitinimonas lacunae TaxID=1963018 RepID=A0ABV8MWA7_9NEIS